MTRRNELKVPKYAFVKFTCDSKTLHLKTAELKASTPVKVNSQVFVPWEGKTLKAVVLGLSDDVTDLFEVERKYMASIVNKQQLQTRKPLLKKSSSILNRAKAVKRKAEQGIEFISTSRHKKPAIRRPTEEECGSGFIRSTAAREVQCVPEVEKDSSPCNVTDTLSSAEVITNSASNSCRNCMDFLPAIDGIHKRLDGIMAFMECLQAKLDFVPTPRVCQPPVVCNTETQTDINTVTVTEEVPVTQPSLPVTTPSVPPVYTTPDPPPCPTTFNDSRIWDLKPCQVETGPVTEERLQYLVETTEKLVNENVSLSAECMASLRKKSHSAGHLAKNIVYHSFTLGELRGRNVCGKNYSNGDRKAPLNPRKFQQVLDIVKLHYHEENLEKTVIVSVNSALRHIWNRKLNLPWLSLQ